ncbi:MAG: diguanylate cyclase [Acidovorax sp.]|nr:diguanylate cyclase [Acidovorax sp.]
MTPPAHSRHDSATTFWWAPGAMVLRLMLVAVVAVGLAGSVSAWLVTRASGQEALRRIVGQQNDEVEVLARLLASKIEQSQKLLGTVATGITPAMLDSPASLEWLLQQGLPASRFFDSIQVARPDGELSMNLRHGRVEKADNLDPAERDYLRRTLADGKPLVSEPIAGHTSEARVMFTMPLHREDGGVLGVVAGAIRLQSQGLLPPSMALPARDDSRLIVFTRDGTILAHSEPTRIMGQVRDEPGLAQVFTAWQRRDQPVVNGAVTQVLPAHIVSMAGMPLPQWLVARVSDSQAQLAPVRGAQHDAWWAAAAALLLIALATTLGMAWLAQPLAQLRHRAPQLLQTDPDPLGPWPRAPGEVDALVEVFRGLERQRAQQQERQLALGTQFQAILDNAPVGIVITRSGRLEVLSRQACHMLGYSAEALQGRPARMLYASDADYADMGRRVRDEFASHRAFDGDVCFMRKDGGPVWARVQGRSLGGGDVEAGTVWILEDMTAAREALRQQGWAALHDPLTLLANRAAFEQRLQQMLAQQAARVHEGADCGVVLFLDLDHFTVVNDVAGHDAGDDVLRHVARMIDVQVRQVGWAARLGGDEFAVVLPGCTRARGQAVAEQLRAALQAWEPSYQGRSFTLGASIGLVVLDARLSTVAEVLHAADMACYAAKRAGRNQVVVHSAEPFASANGVL